MSDEFDQERFFQNVEEEAERIKQQGEAKATNGKAEQDKQTETQAQQLAKISNLALHCSMPRTAPAMPTSSLTATAKPG